MDVAAEKRTRATAESEGFPLGMAALGVAATGGPLGASALGIRWGADPPGADALGFAWVYANAGLAWTWLLLWPAARLSTDQLGSKILAWDFMVLWVAAIPALTVGAFLSGVTAPMISAMLILQAAIAIFALGAIAQRERFRPGIIAATLAMLGVVLPVIGYVWAEFFPAASQTWRGFIPIVAVSRTAQRDFAGGIGWVAATYAAIGIWLLLWNTHPRPDTIKPSGRA